MTEKIEKDTPSFMKTMFFGQIREEMIFPYPQFTEDTTENVGMILDSVQKFAKDRVKSREWDEKGEMPREIVGELSALGLMGLAVDEAHGGLGLPLMGYARVMQDLATVDSSLAVTIGAHQSIGYKALLLYGTDEQKKKYLPRLASGELIACYCLTEPGSGSDAASIKTRAVPSADGKSYEISGSKLWITNGGIASYMTVFAKTEVQEGGEKKEKVTCFMIELPAAGVSVGPAEHKLGLRASWTNAIHFDKVKVPAENIIGGFGKGFKVAMGVLNHGRLGLAAGSVGVTRECLKASILHANERIQFQKKLREFGQIQDKIGTMAINLFAAESMVYLTAQLTDHGGYDYSLESAIAKVFASEVAWQAVDENLQVWGGSGFMKEYPYERWLRDCRINRIFEGTNEILRAFIALSGMQGPGEELAGLADVIKYPLKGLGIVSDFAVRKIRQSVFGETITLAHPALKKLAGLVEENAVQFASQVDVLLRRHGSKIFLRQFAQKRIAEVAIDLYAMSCLLSRMTSMLNEKGGPEKCQTEMAMSEAFFMRANRRIHMHFSTMDRNEDELVKLVADQVSDHGDYPFSLMGR